MGKSTLYRHRSWKKKGLTVNSRGRPPLHTGEEELELKAGVQAAHTTPSRGESNMASTRLLAVRGLEPVQPKRSKEQLDTARIEQNVSPNMQVWAKPWNSTLH